MNDLSKRVLSLLLAVCLTLGVLAPVTAHATTGDDVPVQQSDSIELEVKDYATFLANLKVLEGYAETYATSNAANDAGELVLNFIRTGVERYNDDNWETLAGKEITGFTSFVAEQDAQNATTAMCLRNIVIDEFKLPNGNQVDFGHLFGTMNIAYIAAQASADLGGWAGDICDLLYYAKNYGNIPAGTVDEQAAYILENCFGVDADDAFGMDDFYGDMDAIYLMDQLKSGKALSAAMEEYFTESLSDRDRSEYFMKNRFENLYTKESVREAVFDAYKNNMGLQLLEAKRELHAETELRMACCYAFADYVYAQAGDTLEEPTDPEPEDPDTPDTPDTPDAPEEPGDNPYYSVFSSTTSNLAPGINQTIKFAYTADNKQIVYYLADVDVNRDDVTIKAGYRDADPSKGWGMQRVLDQANAMTAKYSNPEDTENYIENFRAIVATNGAGFNMSTGKPSGLLVMNGKEWNPVDGGGFFAVMKDGSAMIGTTAEYATYKDQIQEGIAGFGSVLIKNGEIVANNDGGRASRTAVGIKADGTVVMMVLDGRQEPFSAGGTMAEIAQIMKDAGCYNAVNLDGGGSTTFVSKPEGSDELAVINRPSDGYQRSVSTSLIAISTAKTSNAFSHVNITSEYDYLTVGTSLELSAVGVSESGNSASIPEGAVWQVTDETIGAVTDGIFTAAANGDVEVQMVLDGEVIGKKTLHVVVPDALAMEKDTINVVFDTYVELPLIATYQGNPVMINPGDVYVGLQYSNAGKVKDFSIYIYEASSYRTLVAGVQCLKNPNAYALITVKTYKSGEAIFDFSNVTAGDKKLAWKRDVYNADMIEKNFYQVKDTTKPIDITYAFGMDMQAIDIPEKLADLTHMLPGADQGKTAWDFLLQLAERVSTLTEVKLEVKFDPNLKVDVSNATVKNEYFYMDSKTFDEETNTLLIVCKWRDQTQAIESVTANPICILSGLKATPKDGAEWDSKNQICVVNAGEVSYKIYLRASSLFSFANIPANQEQYDLHPFSRTLEDGTTEAGAYFGATYGTFEDKFTLDNTNRNGWYTYDDQLFYYKNNQYLTDIQYLPGHEDPSHQYFYKFADDGSCTGTVTGLVEWKDDLYYAVNGAPKTGWVSIMNGAKVDYYFFNTASYKALDGEWKIGGYTYTFKDHILTRGEVVTNASGTRYMWAGQWASQEWLNIDGKIAYARSNNYFETGLKHRYSPEGVWTYYAFSEDGWWMNDFTGIYDWNGGTYLIREGVVSVYPGLFELDGEYYYISSNNVLVKNRQYWISKTNGIVPEGSYWFDADGKMTMPTTPENPNPDQPDPDQPDPDQPNPDQPNPDQPEDPKPAKNGFVEEDGEIWYYVNGVKNYAGLLLIDGDYYYVNTSGKVIRSCTYWVTKTNGLMPEKTYEFGPDGKMIIPPQEPDVPPVDPEDPVPDVPVKNGIIEEDGRLWYYVDGAKVYAGLIQIDGYYYYVRTTGELARSCNYWTTKNNGLIKSAMYTFDDQGRITNPPSQEPEQPGTGDTAKNGIIEENDKLWYYYNGVKTYAGVIKLDGAYYYVNTYGEVKRNCTYWITKTNDLLPEMAYTFGEDGKILTVPEEEPEDPENPAPVKNGIVAERGSLYYYEEGKLVYAGLIYVDGYYYYVRTSGELAHDCKYWPTKNNGHFKVTRQYTFDSQGRMVDPPV